jgi:hypothetical protein
MRDVTRETLLHRRHRRAGQRGAAMVEGLVAIPFFILIFASAVYIHDLYSTKLTTMATTRRSSWESAMGPCVTGNTMTIEVFGFNIDVPAPSANDLAAGQMAPGGQLCGKKFDETSMVSTDSATMQSYMGGGTTEVKSGYRLLCNEKPADADFKKGIEYLWNFYGAEAPLPVVVGE